MQPAEGAGSGAEAVQQMIATRLNRLSAEAQTVVGIAAVVGTAFDIQLVREISGWDHSRVLGAVDELLDRMLIRESAGRNSFDYVFAHHLIRDAVYAAMPTDVRARRHRRTAVLVEQLYVQRQEELAADLARHFDLGGEAQRAVAHYVRAAQRAFELFANDEALTYVQRALTLQPEARIAFEMVALAEQIHGRSGDRTTQRADLEELKLLADTLQDSEAETEVVHRSVVFSQQTADRERQYELITRLKQLAQQSGDVRRAAQAAQAEGVYAQVGGEYEVARERFESALDGYTALADVRGQVECWKQLSEIAHQREDVRELESLLARLQQLVTEQHGPVLAAKVAEMSAQLAHITGKPDLYLDLAQQWLMLAGAVGDRQSQASAHRAMAGAAVELMRFDLAREQYAASAELCAQIGDREGEASVRHDLGFLFFRLGRYDESLACYEISEGLFRSIGHARGIVYCLFNSAGLLCQTGQYRRAKESAVEALRVVAEIGSPSMQAAALVNLGTAEAGLGDLRACLESYAKAVAIARPLGQPAALANYISEYAMHLLEDGQLQSARAHADESLALYSQIGDTLFDREGLLYRASAIQRAFGAKVKSAELLRQSYDMLRGALAAIPDQESRTAFSRDATHRAIVAAYEKDSWPDCARPRKRTPAGRAPS